MEGKKGVRFANESLVRNLNLHKGAVNYKAKTRKNNGPSSVSSSLVRVNQRANPSSYEWNSNKSYSPTYMSLSTVERKASLANHHAVRRAFKNRWVNATVARNTYKEEVEDLQNAYYNKVFEMVAMMFNDPNELIKDEIVNYLDDIIIVANRLDANNISSTEAEHQMKAIFDNFERDTSINKDIFIKAWPTFRKFYLQNETIKQQAKRRRDDVLLGIKKNLRSARAQKANKNANLSRATKKARTEPNTILNMSQVPVVPKRASLPWGWGK